MAYGAGWTCRESNTGLEVFNNQFYERSPQGYVPTAAGDPRHVETVLSRIFGRGAQTAS